MMRYIVLLMASVLVVSCGRKYVTNTYCSISVNGWNTQDTLTINIDTIRQSGNYDVSIAVRSTRFFPYQSLWLMTEMELAFPDGSFRDTLDCRITDEDGNFLGKGLTIHDNVYFLKTLFLKEGQYGKMRLYHIMRRDPLPGISDVGIIIEKHF